ncbi:hypothetical protein RDI58_018472 [Solanum bulbocastanum]|uniref:Transmembrane protein n=1 Tax=Solanum bulbocastanum TaxID=147425 RepID=A0AAN8THD3_SOLBU
MPETTKSLGKILTSPAGFACSNTGCYFSGISMKNRKTKGVAFVPSLLSFLAFMILSTVFRGSLLRTNKKDFGTHISSAKETKAILFTDKRTILRVTYCWSNEKVIFRLYDQQSTTSSH